MKILFINPPNRIFDGEPKFAHPPLGLAYIAACVEGSGLVKEHGMYLIASHDKEKQVLEAFTNQ